MKSKAHALPGGLEASVVDVNAQRPESPTQDADLIPCREDRGGTEKVPPFQARVMPQRTRDGVL